MKIHAASLLIPAAALALVGCTQEVAVRPGPPPPPRPAVIVAPGAPPPPALIVETPGPRPFVAAVWHRGHWHWNGHRYVWVRGYWGHV